VFVPTEEARDAGLNIKQKIASLWKPPSFYFHFRDGGHVAAIRSHLQSNYFYRIDLDDFYGQVNRTRVTRCLKTWLPYSEARAIANESTVKRPASDTFILPYGFVQSPILASLALEKSKLGSCLRKLDRRSDVVTSVYVDDIIISSKKKAVLEEIAPQLEMAATDARLPINAQKTEGPAIAIGAFNITVSHGIMEITEDRLRMLLEAYKAASSDSQRNGIASYIKSVNHSQSPSHAQA